MLGWECGTIHTVLELGWSRLVLAAVLSGHADGPAGLLCRMAGTTTTCRLPRPCASGCGFCCTGEGTSGRDCRPAAVLCCLPACACVTCSGLNLYYGWTAQHSLNMWAAALTAVAGRLVLFVHGPRCFRCAGSVLIDCFRYAFLCDAGGKEGHFSFRTELNTCVCSLQPLRDHCRGQGMQPCTCRHPQQYTFFDCIIAALILHPCPRLAISTEFREIAALQLPAVTPSRF